MKDCSEAQNIDGREEENNLDRGEEIVVGDGGVDVVVGDRGVLLEMEEWRLLIWEWVLRETP